MVTTCDCSAYMSVDHTIPKDDFTFTGIDSHANVGCVRQAFKNDGLLFFTVIDMNLCIIHKIDPQR